MENNNLLLIVPALPAMVNKLYSNWTILQTSSAVIALQPDFNLQLLTTLPEDQGVLRQHIIDYNNQLSGEILSVFQLFISTGSQFTNFNTELLVLAGKLDNGKTTDPDYKSNLQNFASLLSVLQNIITSENPDSNSTYFQLTSVQSDVENYYNAKAEADKSTFDTAYKSGATKYKGDAAALNKQLSGLQQQLNTINSQIAEGAISQIPNAISFGFSIGKAIGTATAFGPSLALNVGMEISKEVLSVIKFEKAYQALSSQLADVLDQYKKTIVQEKEEDQEMSVLITLSNQIDVFVNNIQNTFNSLSEISKTAAGLKNSFSVLRNMDVSPSEHYFTNQVQGAVSFWRSLAADCSKYIGGFAPQPVVM